MQLYAPDGYATAAAAPASTSSASSSTGASSVRPWTFGLGLRGTVLPRQRGRYHRPTAATLRWSAAAPVLPAASATTPHVHATSAFPLAWLRSHPTAPRPRVGGGALALAVFFHVCPRASWRPWATRRRCCNSHPPRPCTLLWVPDEAPPCALPRRGLSTHLGLLGVLEAEVLVEALAWSDVSWDASEAARLSPSSPTLPPAVAGAAGAAPSSSLPPLLRSVRAAAAVVAGDVSVDSFRAAAADADSVLHAACRHFERAAGLRASWSSALETYGALPHPPAAMLSFPPGHPRRQGRLRAPPPSPCPCARRKACCCTSRPDGSRLDVDALMSAEKGGGGAAAAGGPGGEPPPPSASPAEVRAILAATTTLVQASPRRRSLCLLPLQRGRRFGRCCARRAPLRNLPRPGDITLPLSVLHCARRWWAEAWRAAQQLCRHP